MSDEFELFDDKKDIFQPELPKPPDKRLLPSVVDKQDNLLSEINIPEEKRVIIPEIEIPSKEVTQEQRDLVKKAVKDVILYGAESAAMVCKGSSCPYASKCPLLRNKIAAPIGQDCPIELAAIKAWTEMYQREMGINPHNIDNAYDTAAASMMSGLMLQIHRARWGEAINPILEQNLESVTPNGIINAIKTGNFNTDYREKAIKALSKLAKDNVQTRERKLALTNSGFKDKSKHSSAVHARLAEISEEVVTDQDGLIKELKTIKKFEIKKEPIIDLKLDADGEFSHEDKEDEDDSSGILD